MKCISCKTEKLKPLKTSRGHVIHRCPECKSIWMGREVIFSFAENPDVLRSEMENSRRVESQRTNPETGEPLQSIFICEDQLMVEIDPKTGGIWLDAGELSSVIIHHDHKLVKKMLSLIETKPELTPDSVLLTGADKIEGYETVKIQGIVWGTATGSQTIPDLLMASKEWEKNTLEQYRDSLDLLKEECLERIVSMARKKKANAVLNIRFETSGNYLGAYAVSVFGTGVLIKPVKDFIPPEKTGIILEDIRKTLKKK